MSMHLKLILALSLAVCIPLARAAVEQVEVQRRESVLNGQSFGERGAYEKLSGEIVFALDVYNAHNRRVVDLARAPREAGGMVRSRANFMVLRPREASKGNGVALIEVSNRGGKIALGLFNAGRGSKDPRTAEEFGDALLLRLGYTLVWVGWQCDVPPAPDALRLDCPVASEAGKPITGLARSDWVVDQPAARLALGHREHRPYAPAEAHAQTDTLTVRDGREAARTLLPRERWRFVDAEGGADGALTQVELENGFQAGKIYELVYRARDPLVTGLGLTAIRDIASYAKYDKDALFPAKRAIAFGASQSGRFLRHFLYQDFNTDEQGRAVYDAMFIHAAGAGRGSFNHRFAQASRDAHRYNTFFYPTDLFPFAGSTLRDEVSDGLLAATRHKPKIFYTNTGYEYWGRAASLIHTTPDGTKDIEPLAHERIYHLASGQHFVLGFPLEAQAAGVYRGNPLDYRVNLRALLLRLTAWAQQDRSPPPSRYPRIDAGTLVRVQDLKFPPIPALVAPRVAHTAYRADYGARWAEGIIEREPPKLGSPYATLVPQVDAFGNEQGGVRNAELRVPLGTHAPWNLRAGLANPGELHDFYGSFAPLSAARREGDARAGLSELYADRAVFRARVQAVVRQLVEEGFLLAEDAERVASRNDALWAWLYP